MQSDQILSPIKYGQIIPLVDSSLVSQIRFYSSQILQLNLAFDLFSFFELVTLILW